MDYISFTGIIGALILVAGSAWPEGKDEKHPMRCVKNWLFAVGALVMLVYSLMNYLLADGAVFFIFLQWFVVLASVMMLLNTPDRIDVPVIGAVGLGFVIWSLMLFEGYDTLIFICGLIGVGLGYTLNMGTARREAALVTGSILIALFSYLDSNWIFFWLNVFFAVFSGYYMFMLLLKK